MATVDARPGPFTFDPATTALVVIDMQRDFMEPGGFGETLGNDVSQLRRVIAPTEALLRACRATGLTVIHTREGHLPDLSDCPPAKLNRGEPSQRIGAPGPMGRILIRGEHGHDIIDELAPLPGEHQIEKYNYGAFHATMLEPTLRALGVESVVVTGTVTQICVEETARQAFHHGFRTTMVRDAVSSFAPDLHAATLKNFVSKFGWVEDSTAVMRLLD